HPVGDLHEGRHRHRDRTVAPRRPWPRLRPRRRWQSVRDPQKVVSLTAVPRQSSCPCGGALAPVLTVSVTVQDSLAEFDFGDGWALPENTALQANLTPAGGCGHQHHVALRYRSLTLRRRVDVAVGCCDSARTGGE